MASGEDGMGQGRPDSVTARAALVVERGGG